LLFGSHAEDKHCLITMHDYPTVTIRYYLIGGCRLAFRVARRGQNPPALHLQVPL
jgi:hypothetical protein